MQRRTFHTALATLASTLVLPSAWAHAAQTIQSATRLAFAGASTLFVADWRGARIHALSLPQPPKAAGQPFNLKDVQGPIARALHVQRDQLRFEDMKAQPSSEMVYVALTVAHVSRPSTPALVALGAGGHVLVIDLHRLPRRSVTITDEPAATLKLWRDLPGQSLTVTDMQFHDNKLYVAGLSNRSFASTLRIFDVPFRGSAASAITVEMYHPVHNQTESRAPIRTMAIVDLDGVPTLLAAYTCTPLVAIPLSDLKDGAHIAAKTIAELGWGSEPIDMIAFEADGSHYALLLNSSRAADVLPLKAVAEGVSAPGLDKPIAWPLQPLAGVKAVMAPMSATFHVDNLNPALFIAMRRDDATGGMQLLTIPKGVYLRVSDFVDEYDFPDFKYGANDPWLQAHRYLHRIEGYPELVP